MNLNYNSYPNNPFITVITVVFNGFSGIEKTMLSVLEQNCVDVEYVIVDGGSTDGSCELIAKYVNMPNKIPLIWISEKDNGIYDAMNKGIKLATGKYILFLNVDDVLADRSVLSDIAGSIVETECKDIVYGNIETKMEYGSYIKIPGDLSCLPKKHVLSHQATFIKREVIQKNLFNTSYKYAADFEQISSIYIQGYSFVYLNRIVTITPMNHGATYDNYRKSLQEHFDILKKRGLYSSWEKYSLLFRKVSLRFAKTVLPNFISKPIFSFIAKYYKAL
jgi:glycosyltransferase involved in cell wall biosynthesis